jgi:dihydrofolate reductase
MQELLVDFITSLDGYASAEGWPGWWELEGPEYLGWLDEQPERDYALLMGATTYRLMSGFAAEPPDPASTNEADSLAELTRTPKVAFSSSLQAPLSWANTELVSGDAIAAVDDMKRNGTSPMRTIGSVSLCRSLLQAGLVDRFRVVVFPVINRKHWQRAHLRRLPRRRTRHARQSDVRRPNSAPRIRPTRARRPARHERRRVNRPAVMG